jgi:type IV fimbrial biogenesis protein FimT
MQTSQTMEHPANSRTIVDAERLYPAQGGFTLIELIIAVVIVSLLLALAIPSFKSWVLNAQIRDGAEAVLNGIQVARANAIQQNRLVVFELQNAAVPANWRIYLDGNTAGPYIQQWTADEGAKNTVLTPTPSTLLTFNGLGQRVANTDASASITQVDVTSSVSTTAEMRPLRVTVGAAGSPKMCDPGLTTGDPRAC